MELRAVKHTCMDSTQLNLLYILILPRITNHATVVYDNQVVLFCLMMDDDDENVLLFFIE